MNSGNTEATGNVLVDKLNAVARARVFLGREYLLWLWYQVETKKGAFPWRPHGAQKDLETEIWIDDLLILEGPTGSIEEHVMRGGAPSHSAEAGMALAAGKAVRRLKLGVRFLGIGAISLILDAQSVLPQAIRLPEEAPEDHEDVAPLLRRVTQVELLNEFLDSLFQGFLLERNAKDWEKKGMGELRDWMKARQEKTLH